MSKPSKDSEKQAQELLVEVMHADGETAVARIAESLEKAKGDNGMKELADKVDLLTAAVEKLTGFVMPRGHPDSAPVKPPAPSQPLCRRFHRWNEPSFTVHREDLKIRQWERIGHGVQWRYFRECRRCGKLQLSRLHLNAITSWEDAPAQKESA